MVRIPKMEPPKMIVTKLNGPPMGKPSLPEAMIMEFMKDIMGLVGNGGMAKGPILAKAPSPPRGPHPRGPPSKGHPPMIVKKANVLPPHPMMPAGPLPKPIVMRVLREHKPAAGPNNR